MGFMNGSSPFATYPRGVTSRRQKADGRKGGSPPYDEGCSPARHKHFPIRGKIPASSSSSPPPSEYHPTRDQPPQKGDEFYTSAYGSAYPVDSGGGSWPLRARRPAPFGDVDFVDKGAADDEWVANDPLRYRRLWYENALQQMKNSLGALDTLYFRRIEATTQTAYNQLEVPTQKRWISGAEALPRYFGRDYERRDSVPSQPTKWSSWNVLVSTASEISTRRFGQGRTTSASGSEAVLPVNRIESTFRSKGVSLKRATSTRKRLLRQAQARVDSQLQAQATYRGLPSGETLQKQGLPSKQSWLRPKFRRKSGDRYKGSQKHRTQIWLEDVELAKMEPTRLRPRRVTAPERVVHPTIDDQEVMNRLRNLFAVGSTVHVQNHDSPLHLESFVRRHVFSPTDESSTTNAVYLFHLVPLLSGHRYKALVFERSKVRGWNQRQKRRCLAFAEPDKFLTESTVADRFQLMVFPGRWEDVDSAERDLPSSERFSPSTATYGSEFPMLTGTLDRPKSPASVHQISYATVKMDYRQGPQTAVFKCAVLCGEPGGISSPEHESQSSDSQLWSGNFAYKEICSGRQGRRRYRMCAFEPELADRLPPARHGTANAALRKHCVIGQVSTLVDNKGDRNSASVTFNQVSRAFDSSSHSVFSLKQELAICHWSTGYGKYFWKQKARRREIGTRMKRTM